MVARRGRTLALATVLALPACGGDAAPVPGPIDPVEQDQARYQEWLATSPVSPARAVARMALSDRLTFGPEGADVPLEGSDEFLLVGGRGVATLEGPGGPRTVAPYRPVVVGGYSLLLQGDRDAPVVMVFAPPDRPAAPWGFYPIDPSLVFDLELHREKPAARRMLALDGIEVEGHRIGTVTVPLGPEGVTLEVRSVPDLATEEANVEIYFRDATNGAGSYPAGRFVTLFPLGDDRFRLDFNRARGPFCAYSTAYPCPVPWRGNGIPVPVEAGERYGGTDDPILPGN